MKIQSNRTNWSKIAKIIDLGRSEAPFGRSLGPSRVSLGRLWVILGWFLRIGNLTFSLHWSKMTSKRPSGWILGRFGEDLGWIWEGFRRDLQHFGEIGDRL